MFSNNFFNFILLLSIIYWSQSDAGDCHHGRTCSTCLEQAECSWCGLQVAGQNFTYGICRDSCEGVFFGNSQNLMAVDKQLIDVVAFRQNDKEHCPSSIPTSDHELDAKTCTDCVQGHEHEYGWCELRISYSQELVRVRGGVCMAPSRWAYCEQTLIETLRPDASVSVTLTTEDKCSSAWSKATGGIALALLILLLL